MNPNNTDWVFEDRLLSQMLLDTTIKNVMLFLEAKYDEARSMGRLPQHRSGGFWPSPYEDEIMKSLDAFTAKDKISIRGVFGARKRTIDSVL
jgi:hypothetical protein